MAFWNKTSHIKESQENLQESGHTATQLDFSELLSLPYYRFASSLTTLRGDTNISSTIKEAMLKDPIISMIINMWISDTLHKDVVENKIFDVELKAIDKKVNEQELNKIKGYIDYLLENSNLDEILVQVLYQIISDGIVSVRLGFIDTYEDTKIKLFESNKRNLLLEAGNWDSNTKKKLLEAPTYDDYEDELYSDKPSKNKVKRALGRYYFEILPARLVPLKHKGITVLYLDLGNQVKVLNPKNITTFVNTRGAVKKLSIKNDPNDIISDVYEIPLGKSFIENSVTPWSMMNTTEDCTILALMTRSSIYRIFQVEVDTLSTQRTNRLLQDFKKRITTRETIDIRSKHYSSSQVQLPLGDSIILPVRKGIGSLNVQQVGGDLDIKTQVPLGYFRDQLLASLGVPKTLVYGDENGGLINTSATRQDIRYLRMIQQFTGIMSLGLEDIFKDYLTMIGVDLRKLSLKVNFLTLNSEEALQRIEYEQTKQDALDRIITSLENLGIKFENGMYKETRNELIKRYMDSSLLDFIIKDEKNMPNILGSLPPSNQSTDHTPLPNYLSIHPSDAGESLDMEEPTDEDMKLPDVDNNATEEVEPTNNTETNPNPPYSLG